MDFSETLAVLLDLVGEEVNVTLADRESVGVGGSFSGVLKKGQELLRGDYGTAEVVSFEVDGGGRTSRFMLTDGDFVAAAVDDACLTIWEGGVEVTVESTEHGKPLKQPHPYEDGLPSG
jgi:hypothetical protein